MLFGKQWIIQSSQIRSTDCSFISDLFILSSNKLKSLKVAKLKDEGGCEGDCEGCDEGGDEDDDKDDDGGSNEGWMIDSEVLVTDGQTD